MITCDSQRVAVEQFRDAALGLTSWSEALACLGTIIDTPIMQLAGIATVGSLSLNHVSGVSDDMLAGYFAEHGYDPAINPRTRGLLEASPYQCVTDGQLVGSRRSDWRIYDFFDRTDASHAALIRLRDRGGLMSGLAVMRSARMGPHDHAQLRLLQAIAPGVESAIHAAIALGTQQDQVVLATAEHLSEAVILLGAGGEIVSLSASAEAVLRRGAPLGSRGGRVRASAPASDAILGRAIRAASLVSGEARRESRVVLSSGVGDETLGVQLFPMPQRMSGALSTTQVLMAINVSAAASAIDITALRSAYGFTSAEAEIAMLAGAGNDPAAIAARRGTSVQTVRSQLKTIYAKTGARRQAELMLLLREPSWSGTA